MQILHRSLLIFFLLSGTLLVTACGSSVRPSAPEQTPTEQRKGGLQDFIDPLGKTKDTAYTTRLTFRHTKPGVESEVYLFVDADIDTALTVNASLAGPCVIENSRQTRTLTPAERLENKGKALLTWRICQFGTYTVSGENNGVPFTNSVTVQ